MATVLPGTVNLLNNPSWETNESGWTRSESAGITASYNRVTEDSWVGANSAKIAITASTAGAGSFVALIAGQFPITTNERYTLSVRAKPSSVNFFPYVRIDWYTAATVYISSTLSAINLSPSTTAWSKHRASGDAPATATQALVWLIGQTQTANLSGVHLYFDGAQFERSESGTVYCDGDQPGCVWLGTAHASQSQRDAKLVPRGTVGKYGVIKLQPELYLASKTNQIRSNVSDWIVSGRVTLDTDRDVPMTFEAEILYPDRLNTFVDFLAPFLTIVYADGAQVREQVGLYVVVPPNKTYTYHDTRGAIDGRDLTWLLGQQAYDTTYKVTIGQTYVTKIREIIEAAGFTRHDIRDSSKTAGRERSWPPGTSKLEMVNEMLTAIGFYKLHTDRTGRMRSFPFRDIDNAQPAGTYTGGDSGVVVEPFTMEPNLERLANHIIVIKEDAKDAPGGVIKSIRKNTNPASKTSIPNIGEIVKVVRDSTLADQAAADALADKLVKEWSSIYVAASLATFPEPWHDPHEVYELDLTQRERFWAYLGNGLFRDLASGSVQPGIVLEDGSFQNPDYITPSAAELRGRYLCKGWTIGFTPDDGTMEHAIYRIVPFGSQVV